MRILRRRRRPGPLDDWRLRVTAVATTPPGASPRPPEERGVLVDVALAEVVATKAQLPKSSLLLVTIGSGRLLRIDLEPPVDR